VNGAELMQGRAEPILELEGISLSFRGREVLSNVSLSVMAGEIVTLIGPNGAGKSTLMKIALGLVQPDNGHVRRRKALRIGYMPQKVMLDDSLPLTVQHFLRLRPGTTAQQMERVLHQVRLMARIDNPVQNLSGGEMQRLLLARALLGQPDFLVLDEPVQGVDITGQEELYRLITTIRDETGCAVLMISHDLHMVMAGADQVICLNGHICCQGAPDSVRDHPEYRALFAPGVENVALYTHHHDHHHDSRGNVVPGCLPDHNPSQTTGPKKHD
tara:strand:+ start:21164 stop:21979 length:816 start_codon:yes stop_codon:yes gene_type:complete